TGAPGVLGGYVIQLAKADGLTVVADAGEGDEALIADLGADVVLQRGDGFASRVREAYPDGAGGAVDAAKLHHDLAPAVADGGTIVTIDGFDEPGERGITFQPISVFGHAREQAELDRLRQQVEDGTVRLRVADALPKEDAA